MDNNNGLAFEVVKVAGGYLVTHSRAHQLSHGGLTYRDMQVFATWTDASKWLRDAFEVAKPE